MQSLPCAQQDRTFYTCCETPYAFIVPDCAEACLIEAMAPAQRAVYEALAKAVKYGITKKCLDLERKAHDLQILFDLLLGSFRDRMMRFHAAARPLDMQELYDLYRFDCAQAYFQSRYNIDITPWLFAVGIYTPGRSLSASEQASLPVPSDLPCAPAIPIIQPVVSPPFPPIPPPDLCELVADFTVEETVDAADQDTMPPGTYLVITDDTDAGNLWASNVGAVVTDTTSFNMPQPEDLIYVQDTDEWWIMTTAGLMPFLTPVTVIQGLGTYVIQSDYPDQSAAGNRFVLITGTVNGNPDIVIYAGYEYDLPQTIVSFGNVTDIETRFFTNGGCFYDGVGAVIIDNPVEIDLVCGTPQLLSYRYTANNPQSWVITAEPGQVVTVQFAQGEMAPGDIISFYDGPLNTDPLLIAGNYPSLAGLIVTGTGISTQMRIEITPAAAMPDNLDTWEFQIICGPPVFDLSSLIISVTDNCLNYTFNFSVETIGVAGTYNFEVYLNGSGTPIVFGPYAADLIYDLGNYPIGSSISVFIVEDGNPSNSLWLGTYETQGTCPDDPCAPLPDFAVRLEADCAGIPVDGSPFPGIIWMTPETCLGFPANTLIEWNVGLAIYEVFLPVVGQVFVDVNTGAYYVVTTGDPTPFFQLTLISPTGNSPLNATLWMPAIQQFNLLTNRPVAIQVSTNGILWTTIWQGFEQQLASPLAIAVTQPFTLSRSLWYPDTCGYIGPVQVAN